MAEVVLPTTYSAGDELLASDMNKITKKLEALTDGVYNAADAPEHIRLGTSDETAPVVIDSSINSEAAGEPTILLQGDDNKERIRIVSHGASGGYPIFSGLGGRGTLASPAAVEDGDSLVELSARGYYDASNESWAGTFKFAANEDWDASNRGSRAELWLTPDGDTSPDKVLEIDGSGSLEFNGPSATASINATSGNPAIKLVENGTDQWSFYYNTTSNYFSISETGVGDWLKIDDGTGATTLGGSLTVSDNLDIGGAYKIDGNDTISDMVKITDTRSSNGTDVTYTATGLSSINGIIAMANDMDSDMETLMVGVWINGDAVEKNHVLQLGLSGSHEAHANTGYLIETDGDLRFTISSVSGNVITGSWYDYTDANLTFTLIFFGTPS